MARQYYDNLVVGWFVYKPEIKPVEPDPDNAGEGNETESSHIP